jgi:hypothetical protein
MVHHLEIQIWGEKLPHLIDRQFQIYVIALEEAFKKRNFNTSVNLLCTSVILSVSSIFFLFHFFFLSLPFLLVLFLTEYTYSTLIKKKTKFSSYIRKSKRERLSASSYLTKYLPLPSEFPDIWGKLYFLFYQCSDFPCTYAQLLQRYKFRFDGILPSKSLQTLAENNKK